MCIKYLEETLKAEIPIQTIHKSFVVQLTGTIDRIDYRSGYFRIIDYKSSVKKEYDRFDLQDLDEVFSEPKYGKVLQLLVYAWLVWKNKIAPAENIDACIIPFRAQERIYQITWHKHPLVFSDAFLLTFEEKLAAFISGIFDSANFFEPIDDLETCSFCAYQSICNRN